jgi:uncharacterized glyoxalase superfamily protein PhnB
VEAPGLVPSLAVTDVLKAVEWLDRAFGFRERTEARLSWPGGCQTWVELGDTLINLTTGGGHGLRSPARIDGVSIALKVYVDDVDDHFARAKAAGARILSGRRKSFLSSHVTDDVGPIRLTIGACCGFAT